MWTGKEIKYLSLLPELLICFGLNKLLIMQKEMGASLQALPRGYCVCLCGHFLPHKPSLAYKELFSRNMNESKVVWELHFPQFYAKCNCLTSKSYQSSVAESPVSFEDRSLWMVWDVKFECTCLYHGYKMTDFYYESTIKIIFSYLTHTRTHIHILIHTILPCWGPPQPGCRRNSSFYLTISEDFPSSLLSTH